MSKKNPIADIRDMTDEELAAAEVQAIADAEAADRAEEQAYKARTAWYDAHRDETNALDKAVRDANELHSSSIWRQKEIAREIVRRNSAFSLGDIVADDLGVRYRVHGVTDHDRWYGASDSYLPAGTVLGIRLTKAGNEAYARPRPIVTTNLTKVEPDA